jgi:hypothetical protein
LLAALTRAAEPGADIRSLFPRQAQVNAAPSSERLVQLALSPDVLAACMADLSDLRLIDSAGQQVPFVVHRHRKAPPKELLRRTAEATVVRADRKTTPRPGAASLVTETYDVATPTAGPEGDAWVLVIDAASREFTRNIDVFGQEDQKAVALVQNASIFRLPRTGAEQLEVRLPASLPRELRVTISGEGEAYIEPRFRFVSQRMFAEGRDLVLPLTVISSERAGPKTVVTLERHGGVVPSTLRIETRTPAFDRQVVVSSFGPDARSAFAGASRLFRVPGAPSAEQLEVPLDVKSGNALRVEMDDGDSPPLEAPRFFVIVAQPTLVFAPTLPVTLYFGGGHAHLPRYDLSGLVPPDGAATFGTRARAAANLYAFSSMAEASLGPASDNPVFAPTKALAFLMHPGAGVDDRAYSHQRTLGMSPSNDGLARISLTVADLGVLRTDLADVRVVDADSKQWPYLVDRDAQMAPTTLSVGPPKQRDRNSSYRIDVPGGPLAFEQVDFDTKAEPDPRTPVQFFDRGYHLKGVGLDDKVIELAAGRIARGVPGARDDDSLTIRFARARLKSLELVVEDGDNAPLELTARAAVPLPTLYVVAPKGSYRLLLGNPLDSAPSYDIERVRDLVLAVRSEAGSTGSLGRNPSFRESSRFTNREGSRTVLLWGALVLAIATLGFFTLRLARGEGEPPRA